MKCSVVLRCKGVWGGGDGVKEERKKRDVKMGDRSIV